MRAIIPRGFLALQSGRTLLVAVAVVATACLATPMACGTASSAAPSSTVTSSPISPPTSAEQGGSLTTSMTDITMPQPGSPAVPIYKALGWDNVYVVYWLQISAGWAYVHGLPFTTPQGPTLDTRALLQQDTSGEWKVLEKSVVEGLLTDVGQVAEDVAVPQQFTAAHPDAPMEIFPPARPGDILITDAVRGELGNPEYRFNVSLLNQGGTWAYCELRAFRYQGGRMSESRDLRVLMGKDGTKWVVRQMQDIQAGARSDFAAALKAQYPDLPAGLLP
jgi:hypothetical protein